MSIESNKEVVRHFLSGIWTYEKLASLDSVLAPDYVFHGPSGEIHGVAAFKEAMASELEAYSDLYVRVDEELAEGDRVVVRYTTWFTPHGEFMGAFPTGRTLTLNCICINRVADGKVAETWEAYDRRSLLRDYGLEQRLSEEDTMAIRMTIAEAQRIGFADRPTLAKHYWGDSAEIVAANGVTLRGHNAVRAWLEKFPPVSEWKLNVLEMDGAGELAWVRGTYSILLSSRAKLPFDTGQYLEIWRKQPDGSWKVVRNVYNSELATRSKPRAVPQLVHA
jgi:predicted ester cyclase/ketosteroid isomerase-like protein